MIFCHYVVRNVRKDGTVSWEGQVFEVHHNLVGEKVTLVIDPHAQTILRVETASGENLGSAHPIDRIQNTHRNRQRAHQEETKTTKPNESMVEDVYHGYTTRCALPTQTKDN